MEAVYTRLRTMIFVLGLSATALQPLSAESLTPGTGSALSGSAPPAGTVLDTLTSPFVLRDDQDPSIVLSTGTLDSRVVREDDTQMLRFEYQVFVDADSPGRVEFLVAFDYASATTDVDFAPGSSDVAPTSALRGLNASAISFFFPGSGTGGGLQPGEASLPLFVRTDATYFDTNGIARVQQDLNIEDIVGVFQPIPVPEPSAGLLSVLAALGWGLIKGKKRG